MKSLWNSFKAAFAMFSKIPMPMVDWKKENIKKHHKKGLGR